MRHALGVLLAGLVVVHPLANPLSNPGADLSVATNPQGAGVYVDGRFSGETPVTVKTLAAGDHRVRLVKAGYLDNLRIVRLGLERPSRVHVRLTPHAAPGAAGGQEIAGADVERRSKWPWIITGLAGVGAGGYLVSRPSARGGAASAGTPSGNPPGPGPVNNPPLAGSVVATPSIGLAASTTVSFSAPGASDPDGDPLTFTWDFGDGSPQGAGANPAHAYFSAGTFLVSATVSDGTGSALATGTVVIKSLSGTWKGPLAGSTATYNTTVVMTQNGASLSGTYTDGLLSSGTVSGSVAPSAPRITFTVTTTLTQFTFTGNQSADVDTLTGVANGAGFSNAPWTLTRQ